MTTYHPIRPTVDQKIAALRFYAPTNDIALDPVEVEMRGYARHEVPAEPVADVVNHGMNGRVAGKAAIAQYIAAGNATLTMVSLTTGTRYTFKFTRPDADESGKPRPIWVKLLNGPDNTSDYVFLGTLWPDTTVPAGLRYVHSRKSTTTEDAPSVRALCWVIAGLGKAEEVLAQAEFWHEGRCGRCGRKLTVPSSVESGFGPECINHV